MYNQFNLDKIMEKEKTFKDLLALDKPFDLYEFWPTVDERPILRKNITCEYKMEGGQFIIHPWGHLSVSDVEPSNLQTTHFYHNGIFYATSKKAMGKCFEVAKMKEIKWYKQQIDNLKTQINKLEGIIANCHAQIKQYHHDGTFDTMEIDNP